MLRLSGFKNGQLTNRNIATIRNSFLLVFQHQLSPVKFVMYSNLLVVQLDIKPAVLQVNQRILIRNIDSNISYLFYLCI